MCSAALVMNVAIAHISGGDVTEGANDNQVRHAVTKLAHLHFPGTKDSAARILQMGEDPSRVFAVGEPGLDNFMRKVPMKRAELAASLDLDERAKWVLFTQHPETMGSVAVDVQRTRDALDALAEVDGAQIVMTYPNADSGGLEIIGVLEERWSRDPARFKLFKSLGQDRFVSFVREAYAMVGNSSAGVVEAPLVKLPVVNIGDRQRGRIAPANVITVDGSLASIREALRRFEQKSFRDALQTYENPYGDGHTAQRIKEVLKTVPLEGLLRKPFHAPDRR
jgi:UDP-hydrolysing UDP-N-acetyl-D-glucosamine 2-epimerase